MAYAAYRDHQTVVRATPALGTVFKVLEVVVPSVDACRVRRGLARCPGAGVVRSQPMCHSRPTCESAAPRVRLMVRLPLESYVAVLHALLAAAPDGEIGNLIGWREYLRHQGIADGG